MTELPKSEIEKLRNQITKQQENVNHIDPLKELEKYIFPKKNRRTQVQKDILDSEVREIKSKQG